jgi:signal transduction histidine kinase
VLFALFNRKRGRMLVADPQGRITARRDVFAAARHFNIAVSRGLAWIDLGIRDDGTGFTVSPPPDPRTLDERARSNGGNLAVCASGTGAHLRIHLPDWSEA